MGVALMSVQSRTATAQGCCSPSTTPISALQSGPAAPGTLDFGVFYEFYRLEGNRRGSSEVPDPQQRLSELHLANLSVGYAPWSRLGFRAIMPYARRSREQTLSTPTVQRRDELRGVGVGDVALLGLVQALPVRGLRPYGFSLGVGVKLPTGNVHQTRSGVQLPLDLQPGSGSTDLLLTSYGQYYRWPGWNLFAGHVWRLTGTGDDGYRFGNELQVFGALAREMGSAWGLSAEIRYRYASPDERDGALVPSTGGHRLFVVPGASLKLGTGGPALLASALVPLYERVTGTQMATDLGINVALQQRFNI
ncbi:MAG: hypothetical protein HZC42_15730 [Candidatus Eisenbacteria bacterium]|nr:hypothetical protein [Candidatus Eisenbacteria bacterium]